MQERGFSVHVISTPGQTLDQFAAEENVAAHGVTLERRITPIRDLFAIWKLVRLFRTLAPAIVHASTPKGGLLGVLAGRLAGVPLVVYQVRGLPFTGMRGIGRQLLTLTERIACAAAHHVIAVGPSVRDELIAEGISSREKVVVLGSGSSNGVAAETRFNPAQFDMDARIALRRELGIPADAPVVGFVGRLVRDKGLIELAAAWRELSAKFPNSWLLIIGEWEPRDAVPQEVRKALETHSRVRLTGPKSEVAAFYSIMDIVVLPTYREGFPNVPLEAAAMGLPVVATSVTGCVDAVVAGKTGSLVPARDASELAAAVGRYIENPELRRQHGQAARLRALSEFQPEIIWTATYQKYREWLTDKGTQAPGEPR